MRIETIFNQRSLEEIKTALGIVISKTIEKLTLIERLMAVIRY